MTKQIKEVPAAQLVRTILQGPDPWLQATLRFSPFVFIFHLSLFVETGTCKDTPSSCPLPLSLPASVSGSPSFLRTVCLPTSYCIYSRPCRHLTASPIQAPGAADHAQGSTEAGSAGAWLSLWKGLVHAHGNLTCTVWMVGLGQERVTGKWKVRADLHTSRPSPGGLCIYMELQAHHK